MNHALTRRAVASSALLKRLIDAPNLVHTVRALPAPAFSALVRRVGLEDAGELVALATTEQLVAAFDEDLFANDAPGERERFDVARFVVWLEVLLEAGEEAAARRFSELSESFVVHALSALVLVLDNDALMLRMGEGGEDARLADKAIESALTEEIDGYLLIARRHEGWDAVMRLILALDRDERALLERVLDRCAQLASDYLEDLEALTELLTAEESLAEDVEAEREARRTEQGFVEPRAARNFLSLARQTDAKSAATRDPVTQAYFRELTRKPGRPERALAPTSDALTQWLLSAEGVGETPALKLGSGSAADAEQAVRAALGAALHALAERDAVRFEQRMEELVYLANVLVAGAAGPNGRMRPAEAAEAALWTVSLGAELCARELRKTGKSAFASEAELGNILSEHTADALFRKASAVLSTRAKSAKERAFVCSEAEWRAALSAGNKKV